MDTTPTNKQNMACRTGFCKHYSEIVMKHRNTCTSPKNKLKKNHGLRFPRAERGKGVRVCLCVGVLYAILNYAFVLSSPLRLSFLRRSILT